VELGALTNFMRLSLIESRTRYVFRCHVAGIRVLCASCKGWDARLLERYAAVAGDDHTFRFYQMSVHLMKHS
jgi:hypothetical protein